MDVTNGDSETNFFNKNYPNTLSKMDPILFHIIRHTSCSDLFNLFELQSINWEILNYDYRFLN